jgi:hypothetical protein
VSTSHPSCDRHVTLARSVLVACAASLAACFSQSSGPADAGAHFDAGFGTDAEFPVEGGASGDAGADAPGPAAPGIYVTNGNDTVTVYALGASGNAAPVRTLSGASTQLSVPIGIAVDANDELLVANRAGGKVTVYPALATGDVAPTRTLTATGMGSPEGLVVGPAGDVFVSTCPACGNGNGGSVAVFHFPGASASSDFSLAGASTGFTDPACLALDGSGNLWVANAFGGDVALFASSARDDATPTSSFTPTPAANIQSLAYGDGVLFLAAPAAGIELYPPSTTGTASAAAALPSSAQLPIDYPGGMFVDSTASPPIVYLDDYGASAVYVIHTAGTAPNLTVASVTTIQGAATGLSGPVGIHVVR